MKKATGIVAARPFVRTVVAYNRKNSATTYKVLRVNFLTVMLATRVNPIANSNAKAICASFHKTPDILITLGNRPIPNTTKDSLVEFVFFHV